MGKKITIEREKTLAGSGIEYFVVLNLSEGEFLQSVGRKEKLFGANNSFLNESKQVFSLSNGETITINISGRKNSFFIAAFPSPDRIFSQRVFIDNQDFEARYSVTLKLGIFGNQFAINKM